jgi:MoxR-like ATPase
MGARARGVLKALFTGEPGTGKTLAAEVIATELARTLILLNPNISEREIE